MAGLGHLSMLSLELVERIQDGLCGHHVESLQETEESFLPYSFKDEAANFAGLAGLCRASKLLNRIATWRLYHTLTKSKIRSRWLPIARTLIEREDLARLVRHISMEDFELCEDPSLLPPAVRTWYAEHLAQAPDTSGLYADSLTKGDPSFSDGAVDFAAVALLTSLCPKLSSLNFTQYQHATAFAFCAPASVLSLRDVEASHWDTEGGFDLELLAPLFRAAPNLRSLRLAQVGCEEPLDEGLRLDYLTDLDMYSCCIPGDELIHIIRLCPNLKRLRYECGGACYGEEQFGPLEAANIILEYAISLRTVELCLDDMDQFSDGYENLKENEDQARLVLARHRIEYKPVYYN